MGTKYHMIHVISMASAVICHGEHLTRLFLFLYLYLYLFFISSECLFGITKRFICLHNKLHLFT